MADEVKLPWYKRINEKWVNWALTVLLTVVVGYLLGRPATPIPTPPDEPIFGGWVKNDDAVREVRQGLPTPFFADTEAGKDDIFGTPESVYLWKAQVKVTGSLLGPYDQNPVGSCVAFGTTYATEASLCVAISQGDMQEFRSFSREIVYGGSRVQIGKGRIRGDGSVGAWAAQFVNEFGNLPRDRYDGYDLREYNPSTCREFGARGVPAALLPKTKDYPVQGIAQVRNVGEARKALANGYAIAVCSSQGFTRQRDADGFCRASGIWQHCMAIDGYQSGRRPGFHVVNSWGGNYHTGPTGAGEPNSAGFWADEATVDRMLSQGDSWAFSGVKGFKKNKLPPWFVRHEPTIRPLEFQPFARFEKKENVNYALGI